MITIHGIFGSPFVRAVRIALHEKHLPWAWAPFPLGAQKQEPYLSLHPFGKIPAIDDDGVPIYETQAILRHIERKAATPSLIPSDPLLQTRMDQVLAIVDCYLWPLACRGINFNRLIAPRIGVPVDEQAVADGVPFAETSLRALAALQGAAPYLAGDALSLADVAVVPHLDALAMTPEGAPLLAGQPGLRGWLENMRARPSVRQSWLAPEKVLTTS
jgi:glutathione S-transferase